VKKAPRRDGDVAVARIVVMGASAIGDVESGRRRAVSCGYQCDYDPTPRVTPSGERYDGVRTTIRGNHLALVTAGSAGPEARVRLDAVDAVQVTESASINRRTQQTLNLLEATRRSERRTRTRFSPISSAVPIALRRDRAQRCMGRAMSPREGSPGGVVIINDWGTACRVIAMVRTAVPKGLPSGQSTVISAV
jgi:hypothetical protein